MLQRDQANEYLSKFDLTVDDLLAEIPDFGKDEVLMLVGSVSEGMANHLSDIDILVAGTRPETDDLVLKESNRERVIRRFDSGYELNIEYWTWARLKEIADEFAESAYAINNPNDTDKIIVFDDEEQRIVHYIINGLMLAGEKPIYGDIFDKETYADYLTMVFMTRYMVSAEDCLGQVMVGDMESASFNLGMAMEMLSGAETASLSMTHPALRWRLKLLRKCKPEIGEDVYDRYLSYFFGGRCETKQDIEAGLKFGQERMQAMFMRRPKVFAAAGALSQRMKFVTSFEATPEPAE